MKSPSFGHGLSPWHRACALAWLASAALLSTAMAAASQLGPALSLDEAGRLALARQPQLAAQQAMVTALQENAVAARELPDPKLRFGVANLPVDSYNFSQEPMTQAVIGISQLIPGGDKRQVAGERAQREAEQADLALAASHRRIERDVRLAWLDAYLPGASIDLLGRIDAEFQRQVEWSEVAYQTGQMSQEETLALRGMLENNRERMAEQRRLKDRALAGLGRWLGEAARRPLGEVTETPPPRALTELEASIDRHPELQAMRQAVRVAQADAEQARQAYKPDWNVDVSYGARSENRADFISLVVGIDLPIFTANRQDRRLAARLANVEQIEQLWADRRLALIAELRTAHADWVTADARLKHFERDILPLAQRRVESALNSYGTGKVSYGRVLDARRAELEARLGWLSQRIARAKATVMLNYFSE